MKLHIVLDPDRPHSQWRAALLLVVRLPAEARANDRDVGGVTLTGPNPGELVIAWDAPGNAPDEYRVTWKKSSAKWPSHKDENTEAASARYRRPRA